MVLRAAWKPMCVLYSILLAVAALLPSASGAEEGSASDQKKTQSESTGFPAAGDRGEFAELKRQIADQQRQIADQQRQLAEQQRQLEELRLMLLEQRKSAGLTGSASAASQNAFTGGTTTSAKESLGEVASATPILPAATAVTALPVLPQTQKKEEGQDAAPLQFRLGSAYFTPVGFMDFTAVFRDTDAGSNIGTNFGSLPYRTATNVAGNLSEFRLSPQNSRLGMRVDASVKGAHVLGYWESDFLGGTGNPPVGNISVSSNSYPFRLRLYWVDVRKGKFEFLGGQTWSLITPGRKGISPLPGDLFYSQDIDVNYQLGLTWGRIPEFRMVYHPSDKVTMALALGNAEQYIGGSGGAGTIVLPTNLATAYGSQLNNGTTTLGVPNMHPDILVKIAFDPTLPNGNAFHFEIGGVERTFKTYNPLTGQHFTTAGGGAEANLNFELVKGFRFVTNNYWSDGGGRYIFGQAPDLVVRTDGSVSPIHSASTVSGFELTHKNFLVYTYYGGVYIARNVVYAPGNGNFVGYGYSGSANSQNRSVQEGTIGFTNTFWKDAKYGALSLMMQYSYFTRNPWYVASGAPKATHMNEVWLNLRYALPGSAPKLE